MFKFFRKRKKKEIIYVVIDRLFMSIEDDIAYLVKVLSGDRGDNGYVMPLKAKVGGVRKVDSSRLRVDIEGVDYESLNQYLKDFDGLTVLREFK